MSGRGGTKMRCRTCSCELNKKNPPAAALDFGGEEDGDGMKYYCSSKCLVEWIMTFAVICYGEEQTKAILQDCKLIAGE